MDQAAATDEGTLANGMPYGTIGELKFSRLILGSNTPGAHSTDLIYVTAMGRAYNTPERLLDIQIRENAHCTKQCVRNGRQITSGFQRRPQTHGHGEMMEYWNDGRQGN